MTEFEQIIKYQFKNTLLMDNCLVHSSYANENNVASNERLEFLGDSILNLITTNFLFKNFDIDEGELSKLRANLVSADNLSKYIDKMELTKFMKYTNKSMNISTKIKGDLYEAILGAIYLDCGYLSAKKFVENTLNFKKINLETHENSDYKTVLQETVQVKKKSKLKYVLISKKGPSHRPEFTVGVEIDKNVISTATANSKKRAENMAAKQALEILKGDKI